MAPYLETAIQWLHDTIRCQIRSRREDSPPPPPGDWVALCWDVGHSLAMMQAHGIPAQPVIEAVSARLVAEFGPDGDLTPYGLRTMRQFYLDYFERPALQPSLREVDWDCHKLILSLCRDPAQQEYYLEVCRKEGLASEALAAALKQGRYEVSAALGRPSPSAKAAPVVPAKAAKGAGGKAVRKGLKKALGKATTRLSTKGP